MSYSVIILSRKIANVVSCVAAICQNQPGVRVFVVADGIPQSERAGVEVEWINGITPFCFARNAHLGIAAAGADDVILCNDDAKLNNPGGFDKMAVASKNYGIVSATITGRCCNARQKVAQDLNVTEPKFLAFVCVYITRATFKTLGPLDEQFVGGNYEDNDYCWRAAAAGISLGICGLARVDHDANAMTFARQPNYATVLAENKARFEAKWNITKTTLSVCICSIFTRKPYLDRLLATLSPQLCNSVELLMSIDAGQVSIGTKRQSLLEQARGEFIVFIDDDDLISADFIAEVLSAHYRNPSADAITYRSKRYCDGVYEADCIYSIANTNNSGAVVIDGFKTYTRFPYHVTPIRRELALKVGFQNKDHQEDTDFAVALRPLIKTEEHIEKFLYFYWWRSDRKAEQTHRTLVAA